MYRTESSQPSLCDKCGRPRPATSAVCPHCADGGLARIELSEQVAARMKEEGSGVLARAWPTWLRAAIFLLACPVIVPSLVVHWVFAKRWGRVPYFSVFADAFIMLLFCLGSPVLLPAVVLFIACALVLLFRSAAQGRANSGIFLGYSNAVVMPLILGGLLLAVGVGVGLPSGSFRRASAATATVTNYPLAAALDSGVPVPKSVRFADARVSLAGRVEERAGTFSAEASAAPSRTWHPVEQSGGRLWIVARGAPSAAPAAQGLFLRMPIDSETALRAARPDAFKQITHGPAEVFVVLSDSALYEEFGVIAPAGEVGWGWLAIGLVGLLALAFATWRAVSEEEE